MFERSSSPMLHSPLARRILSPSSPAKKASMAAAAAASSKFTCSAFTRIVVDTMRKLYPEKLADSSFDNTGLLLEAPPRPLSKNSVLLTVDLTRAVADEAIRRRDSVIVTYHPIIFHSIKSLTLANTQQATLLRLAQEGISVYSPHTAVDAAPGGLNDWLADIVATDVERETEGLAKNVDGYEVEDELLVAHYRKVIKPVTDVPGFTDAGYGRIVRFEKSVKLSVLLDRIALGLNLPDGLSVGVPQGIPVGSRGDMRITTIGICAGSGGSLLAGVDVDMLFTGELVHHEALAAIEQGRVVVTTFHSNSERGYLAERMQHLLGEAMVLAVTEMPVDKRPEGLRDPAMPLLKGFDIAVSEADRDPFKIVVAGTTKW